jgi:hypothetical protein
MYLMQVKKLEYFRPYDLPLYNREPNTKKTEYGEHDIWLR